MDSERKRKMSPGYVTNPFIKKRNLEWRISPPPLSNPERRRDRDGDEAHQGVKGSQNGETRCGNDSDKGQSQTSRKTLPATAAAAIPRPHRPISPPPSSPSTNTFTTTTTKSRPSTSALIESAQLHIDNHLTYFTALLATHTLNPYPTTTPRLPLATYAALYTRATTTTTTNGGAHFVVTQHDHPVAGPHYDLRLQINPTSSCSWAIMYGLPGDPNSRGRTGRTGSGMLRNATETRVHCLWNHLVETAGRETGSLLVWDTGEYEVLGPRRAAAAAAAAAGAGAATESESESDGVVSGGRGGDDGGNGDGDWAGEKLTQQQKLARAFASRKIRLKLHGTRLPRTYVVNLRLTHEQDAAGRAKAAASAGKQGPRPRRRRRQQQQQQEQQQQQSRAHQAAISATRRPPTGWDTSDSEDGGLADDGEGNVVATAAATTTAAAAKDEHNDGAARDTSGVAGLSEMDKELRELEDEEVRRTNAYKGAVNTIGSVHQRKWFLSLDREACGFVRGTRDGRVWWEQQRKNEEVDEDEDEKDKGDADDGNRLTWPFYVRGPRYERSVVTGRLGEDVLRDEGVVDYVGRKGWRPILG